MKSKHSTRILTITLYTLAAITLIAAVITLLSALDFSRNANNAISAVTDQADGPTLILANLLEKSVSLLGILFASIVFIISAMLFTARQLVVRSSAIAKNIGRLEARLDVLEKTE